MELHVAGSFELLKDDIVHAAARIDQGRGHDGEASPLLDVARGSKEALRPLQGVAVHATGQHLPARRHNGVVGARQTRDAVQQNHDVPLVFDESLGFLQHHFGHLHVAGCRLVKRRANDLSLYRALHVGDFLGSFVNQQNDQDYLRMVL